MKVPAVTGDFGLYKLNKKLTDTITKNQRKGGKVRAFDCLQQLFRA